MANGEVPTGMTVGRVIVDGEEFEGSEWKRGIHQYLRAVARRNGTEGGDLPRLELYSVGSELSLSLCIDDIPRLAIATATGFDGQALPMFPSAGQQLEIDGKVPDMPWGLYCFAMSWDYTLLTITVPCDPTLGLWNEGRVHFWKGDRGRRLRFWATGLPTPAEYAERVRLTRR